MRTLKGYYSSLERSCQAMGKEKSRLGHQPNMVTQEKVCLSSEDFVTSRTSTKSGPKKMCTSSDDFVTSRSLTKSGPKNVPLVRGLCHVTDFDQINGPNVRPSSEDFVTSRTSTKYGPKMCPSSEDFVMSRTLTKYGPKMCPLSEDFITSRTLTK